MKLARKNGAGYRTTWFELATPAFVSADRVVYSAKMFSGQGYANTVAGSGFGPCSISVALRNNPAGVPNADHQGVFIEFKAHTNVLRVQLNMSQGQLKFQSNDTNLIAANTWYEIQLVVTDPEGSGLGQIFLRNLSQNGEFTPVDLDDLGQAGTQHIAEIPLFFAAPYIKPTVFNGWEVWGQNDTVHFDDFSAALYPYVELFDGPVQ